MSQGLNSAKSQNPDIAARAWRRFHARRLVAFAALPQAIMGPEVERHRLPPLNLQPDRDPLKSNMVYPGLHKWCEAACWGKTKRKTKPSQLARNQLAPHIRMLPGAAGFCVGCHGGHQEPLLSQRLARVLPLRSPAKPYPHTHKTEKIDAWNLIPTPTMDRIMELLVVTCPESALSLAKGVEVGRGSLSWKLFLRVVHMRV